MQPYGSLPMLAFSSNTGLVNSKYVSASVSSWTSSMVVSSPSVSTNTWSSLTIISSSTSISSSARTTPERNITRCSINRGNGAVVMVYRTCEGDREQGQAQ